jgi:hypothetical protein
MLKRLSFSIAFILLGTACSSNQEEQNQVIDQTDQVQATEVMQFVEMAPTDIKQAPTASATTKPTLTATASATPIPPTETLLPTSTPEPTLTPTLRPAADSIEAAREQLPGVEIDHINIVSTNVYQIKWTDENESYVDTYEVTYTLAYRPAEVGPDIVVARYDAETQTWIQGGPFTAEDINTDKGGRYPGFPLTPGAPSPSPEGGTATMARIESRLDFENGLQLEVNGTSINRYAESLTLMHWTGAPTPEYPEGAPYSAYVVYVARSKNADGAWGEGVVSRLYEDGKFFRMNVHNLLLAHHYGLSIGVTFWNPDKDGIFLDPNDIDPWQPENYDVPLPDFGDYARANFSVAGISGRGMASQIYPFWREILYSYDLDAFGETGNPELLNPNIQRLNGIPIVVAGSGASQHQNYVVETNK